MKDAITIEFESRSGEDIDLDDVRRMLDSHGYKLQTSANGYRMLAVASMRLAVRQVISAALYGSILTIEEIAADMGERIADREEVTP